MPLARAFLMVAVIAVFPALSVLASAEEPDGLAQEVAQLRADVLELQQTLDMYMGQLLADLKAENEQLRQELRRAYRDKDISPPAVPAPEKSLLEQVLDERLPEETAVAEPGDNEEPPAEADDAEDIPLKPTTPQPIKDPAIKKAIKKDGYAIVAEWGRTPDEATALGKPGSSLKGMICVVDAEASDDTLIELGKKLRAKFADYTNVNVEAFDDLVSAQQYNEQHSAPAERRVLSVSKHTASGRDTVVLIRKGIPKEIPQD